MNKVEYKKIIIKEYLNKINNKKSLSKNYNLISLIYNTKYKRKTYKYKN